jgi:hypothetical protein|tara:strand:- start:309 stop:434 length:126 start_codon:yes stop_codon:yes gene_type:complete
MIDLKTLTIEQLHLVAHNQRIYSGRVKQEVINEIKERENKK